MSQPFSSYLGRNRRATAFTLIELLVVISIIGVLVAITLPIYARITQQGRLTTTVSNMRQMGVAFLSYAGDHNYQLPGRVRPIPGAPAGNTPQDKWIIALQPYYQDTRVLICPLDPVGGVSYKVTDPTKLLSNDVNNTCYISNGYNDLGAYNDPTINPLINNVAEPTNTILLGIPYPQKNNFYMDFVEHNQTDILNRTPFNGNSSVYVFTDGSARPLQYVTSYAGATVDMNKKPPNSGVYTDWLWLVNKSAPIASN